MKDLCRILLPLLLLPGHYYYVLSIVKLQLCKNPFFFSFATKLFQKSLSILLRCKNTLYRIFQTFFFHSFLVSGRHSVVAPFSPSGTGVLLGYKFMDLGSCSGGLNRRETALVFTLEDSEYVHNFLVLILKFSYCQIYAWFFLLLIFRGNVLGRQVLQLRICTCPKRDMDQDEKNSEKQVSKNVLSNSRRLDPVSTDKRQAFWVLVSDNLKLANKNATFARMLQCISLTN